MLPIYGNTTTVSCQRVCQVQCTYVVLFTLMPISIQFIANITCQVLLYSIFVYYRPVLNKKTRDQASLEHDFSVSKIQLLRSELAKINSSLQAYQPER